MYVFLKGGTSARSWDVFPISSEPFQGAMDDFFCQVKLSAKKRAKLESREGEYRNLFYKDVEA